MILQEAIKSGKYFQMKDNSNGNVYGPSVLNKHDQYEILHQGLIGFSVREVLGEWITLDSIPRKQTKCTGVQYETIDS